MVEGVQIFYEEFINRMVDEHGEIKFEIVYHCSSCHRKLGKMSVHKEQFLLAATQIVRVEFDHPMAIVTSDDYSTMTLLTFSGFACGDCGLLF